MADITTLLFLVTARTAPAGNPLFLFGVPLEIFGTEIKQKLTNPNLVKIINSGIKIYGNKGTDAAFQHLRKTWNYYGKCRFRSKT